jgi:hypothetical protein
MEGAKDTLKFYFKTVWEKTGLEWNEENDMEIEAMVDAIRKEIEWGREKGVSLYQNTQ